MALNQDQFEKLKIQLAEKSKTGNSMISSSGFANLREKLNSVGTGIGKELVGGAIDTARMFQGGGQRLLAGIDPTQNLEQVRETTGFPSLKPDAAEGIDQFTKANNSYERAGKVAAFIGSVLFPGGATREGAAVLSKGGKVAGATFDNLGSKVSGIGDDVVEGGVKVKDKVIDLISGLDDKTKTALKRTPKELFDSVVEKGKAALTDDRNRTPLEGVGDQIIDGLKQVKERASSIGSQKAEYLNQAKIGLKRTGNIVRDSILNARKQFSSMKLDASDSRAVNNFIDELKKISDNPTLQEVDRTIDLLQDTLYKAGRNSAVEVTDRVTGPLRKIVGELNSKAGEIGGPTYKKFNKEYSDLISIVTELNARVGKEGSSAGAFVKRLFSPSDARTKELFELLQKYTGQDYFRDARLAKFVMETLGDTRAASLLEQVPTSAKGAVMKAIDFGIKKITDPIKSAGRFIDKKKSF